MNKTFTCILCPNGCEIRVQLDGTEILFADGNKCPKGAAYVEQEIKNPVRNIASSVLVVGGTMPLCSVRLTAPVPKSRIFDVMEKMKEMKVSAPVKAGDVLIPMSWAWKRCDCHQERGETGDGCIAEERVKPGNADDKRLRA